MRVHSVVAALVACLLAAGGVALAASDPYRPSQWGLDRIRAPEAWSVSRGTGIVVAVVDSGVMLDHPDLAPRLLRDASGRVIGRDFVDGDDVPQDEHGHGTMVAGIVAAEEGNGIGIAGVAPEVWILPIRVLDEEGAGQSSDVDAGIRWAVDQGAHVINLSLESVAEVAGARVEAPLTAPAAAVQYAWNRGVVVVAAAGNSGNPFTDYPPTSPVLLVGATDADDRRTDFSDAGRDDMVMAPGTNIVSTWCEACGTEDEVDRYGKAEGTSFAAPFVSGTIALLRATGLDHAQSVQRVRETARDLGPPGRDLETGYGLVDAAAAVGVEPEAPAAPSPSPTPAAPPSPSPSPSPSPVPTAAGEVPPVAASPPAEPEEPPGETVPSPVAPEPPAQSPPAPHADGDGDPERVTPPTEPDPESEGGAPEEVALPAAPPSEAVFLRAVASLLVAISASALALARRLI